MITWAQFGPTTSSVIYQTEDNQLYYRNRIDQVDLEEAKLLYNKSAIIPPKVYYGQYTTNNINRENIIFLEYALEGKPSLWWSKSGKQVALALFDTEAIAKQTRVNMTTYQNYQVNYPVLNEGILCTTLTTIDLNQGKMNSILQPASESGVYLRHVYWLTDNDYLAFWTDRYQSIMIIEHCNVGEIDCQQVIKQTDVQDQCYLIEKVKPDFS